MGRSETWANKGIPQLPINNQVFAHEEIWEICKNDEVQDYRETWANVKNGQLPIWATKTVGEDKKWRPRSEAVAIRQREAIRKLIAEDPDRSDRDIAKELGVSHHTVGAQRQRMKEGLPAEAQRAKTWKVVIREYDLTFLEALSILDIHKGYTEDPKNGDGEQGYYAGMRDMLEFIISDGGRIDRHIIYSDDMKEHIAKEVDRDD